MTPLAYAARGWRVFPCRPDRKPITEHGFKEATCDEAIISAWWRRWPDALIGVATGAPSGVVVLDVDVKHPPVNGFDTLDELGFAILPDTPMAHTQSGGLHLYFDPGSHDIRNTTGAAGRGIGPGLDWRGTGGYVIVPSEGSGYWWDPHWNLESAVPVPVPAGLLPRVQVRESVPAPVHPSSGLSPYGEAALRSACDAIIMAPAGEQEITLHRECFSIGALVGAGGLPRAFARSALHAAASRMPDYDPGRPWHAADLAKHVDRSFENGCRQPRGKP